jgi:glycosyltransferase involved in cell wall biosynthesis
MIIVVAPYSPPNRVGLAHLGASRKIETLISILFRLDSQLVLVNSAHNDNRISPISVRQSKIAGLDVVEITPPISSNHAIGKLKNIFCVDQVLDAIKKLGVPQLIWFYNGYAFEMRLALKAQKIFPIPMILEFEDWHFSRSRGLNPKPYIDYLLWRKAAQHMSAAFAVNSFLAAKMQRFINDIELLPGLVPTALANIAKKCPPFSSDTGRINIGYFGGLSVEKGADIILQLADKLPSAYTLHVTGTGPLEAEFMACSKMQPEKLRFHGRVDDVTLYQLIAKCDVILNPHASIKNMNNGIFPFKVIEAVASGRLLISTAVPTSGLEDLMAGVQFVEHSANAFFDAITVSRQYYLNRTILISQSSLIANQRFGENSLLDKIKTIMNAHGI